MNDERRTTWEDTKKDEEKWYENSVVQIVAGLIIGYGIIRLIRFLVESAS